MINQSWEFQNYSEEKLALVQTFTTVLCMRACEYVHVRDTVVTQVKAQHNHHSALPLRKTRFTTWQTRRPHWLFFTLFHSMPTSRPISKGMLCTERNQWMLTHFMTASVKESLPHGLCALQNLIKNKEAFFLSHTAVPLRWPMERQRRHQCQRRLLRARVARFQQIFFNSTTVLTKRILTFNGFML